MFHRRPSAPRGWELAPPLVEQEVMVLWQDEDMPAELKAAPGYVPFMVSAETQAWIDSMLEVREVIQGDEHHVAGRPRPRNAQPVHHLTSSPPPPPTPAYTPPSPPPTTVYGSRDTAPPRETAPPPVPTPAPPPVSPMPEIVLGRSLKISRRPSPTPTAAGAEDEGPVMPDIDVGKAAPQRPYGEDDLLMPEIDT